MFRTVKGSRCFLDEFRWYGMKERMFESHGKWSWRSLRSPEVAGRARRRIDVSGKLIGFGFWESEIAPVCQLMT